MTWLNRRVSQRLRVLGARSQSGGPMSRTSYPAGLASPTAPLAMVVPRNPDAITVAVDELFNSYGWGPGIDRRLG